MVEPLGRIFVKTMENKLAKYRAQKEYEAKRDNFKEIIASYFTRERSSVDKESKQNIFVSQDALHLIDTPPDSSSNSSVEDDHTDFNSQSFMNWIYYVLIFILWATTYAIFIKLEFGTVYLIMSGLIGIYLNTRTGPKAVGEVSAYSVFNEGCKSIDGTLKAEQFEREIRLGPSVIH